MAALLAVLGHQPADVVEAMDFGRFVAWTDNVLDVWCSLKGIDPDEVPGLG